MPHASLLRPCERCGVGFHAHKYGCGTNARQWTRFCSVQCAHNGTRGPNKGTKAFRAMYYLYHVYPSGLTSRDLAKLLSIRVKDVSHYLYHHVHGLEPVLRSGGEDAPRAPIMLRYFLTELGYTIAQKRFGGPLREIKGVLCEGLG